MGANANGKINVAMSISTKRRRCGHELEMLLLMTPTAMAERFHSHTSSGKKTCYLLLQPYHSTTLGENSKRKYGTIIPYKIGSESRRCKRYAYYTINRTTRIWQGISMYASGLRAQGRGAFATVYICYRRIDVGAVTGQFSVAC